MSYWISEDSTTEDLERLEDILSNFITHLSCYKDNDLEGYDYTKDYPPATYLPALERFLENSRSQLDDMESLLNQLKAKYL